VSLLAFPRISSGVIQSKSLQDFFTAFLFFYLHSCIPAFLIPALA